MKTIATLTALCTLFVAVPSRAGGYCPVDDDAQPRAARQLATLAEAKLLIEGMRTSSCPLLVKAALRKLKGVTRIAVDADQKLVTVTYDPSTVSVDQIQATIKEKAGFDSRQVG